MSDPVIIVLGAGPGIGIAVARRFARAGYAPALIARTADKLEALGRQLQSQGFTAGWSAVDITDQSALTRAIERFAEFGPLQHLHFNPSAFTHKDALELTADELLSDFTLGVVSLLTAVQAARPFMSAGARITATGGASADRPFIRAASLGVQKAGLRNLVKAIDGALAQHQIRAMSLTVAGTVADGGRFDPAHIADAIFDGAQTENEFWTTETVFNGRD